MTTGVAFVLVMLPLVVTILIEVLVAASFGLRSRALGAVAAVNLVTNPVLTAVMAAFYWQGIGYASVATGQWGQVTVVTAPWLWAVVVAFEMIIIVVEWRMLVWALAGSAGSGRRLLTVTISMNAVSAILGTWLLSYPLFNVLGCFVR